MTFWRSVCVTKALILLFFYRKHKMPMLSFVKYLFAASLRILSNKRGWSVDLNDGPCLLLGLWVPWGEGYTWTHRILNTGGRGKLGDPLVSSHFWCCQECQGKDARVLKLRTWEVPTSLGTGSEYAELCFISSIHVSLFSSPNTCTHTCMNTLRIKVPTLYSYFLHLLLADCSRAPVDAYTHTLTHMLYLFTKMSVFIYSN